MKNPLKNQRFFAVVLSVLISVFLVAIFVYAATTIGSNINTGGTLSVTGATSLSTASTTGNFWLGNQTADDDDYLYMDASSTEYLMWDELPGHFVFSDGLQVESGTSTGNFIIGASAWAVPTSTLTVVGTAYINNKATTSHAFWIGTGGTANNIDLDGGDLYVQDGAEIDGGLWVNAATTTDTLYIGGYASTTGNIYLGMGTASGDDYLYFDENGNLESLMWDDAPGQFVLSDDLDIQGNATTTGNFIVGTSAWTDRPTSTFSVIGSFHATGIATASDAFWVGSGGTATNIDLAGGDLYVQNDAEIDNNLFVTGTASTSDAIFSGNATTTGNMVIGYNNQSASATTTVTFGSYDGADATGVCFKIRQGNTWIYCYPSGSAFTCSGTSCE